MVKSRILRSTAAVATSLGLVTGVTAGIAGASSGTIDTTGPYSSNKIVSVNKMEANVENDNHLYVSSNNAQSASTGSADVTTNTTGGSAKTGNATNSNMVTASVTLKNSMPSGLGGSSSTNSGTVKNTGPYSDNKVVSVTKTLVNVENNNSICLTTNNEQSASSGDALVSGNTTGGSATSGNATNTNTSSFTISVSN